MTVLLTAHAWDGDMVGGAFKLASEFARHLAAEGHHVVYACCDVGSKGRRPSSERLHGVEVRRYEQPSGPSFARMAAHVARSARLVKRVTREHDVVVHSGHSPLQFLGAALALRGARAFSAFTVHSPFDDELLADDRRGQPWIVGQVARRIDRRNLTLADRIHALSDFTARLLAQKHGSAHNRKAVIIPGWVDTERFRPVTGRRRLRAVLGPEWRQDLPIFFTLRRLESRMGIETLIEAADILRRDGGDFRVLIGGDGSLRHALEASIRERRLADRVRLLGRIAEENLPRCYAAADCFVLPTRSLECFGLIVLEAFACATPVIASRAGAIPELAAVQGEDWLFTPGDARELADRMHRFLSGRLVCGTALDRVAREYDRRLILPRWRQMLFDRPA